MTAFALPTRHLVQVAAGYGTLMLTVLGLLLGAATRANASAEQDARAVAALDTKYQPQLNPMTPLRWIRF